MTTTFLITAAVAFAAVSTQAWAQDGGARVEINAARHAAVERVLQAHEGEARYAMSTGRVLALASSGELLTLRYGRHLQRTLHPASDGGFVSADGRVRLDVELDRDGLHQVRLTLPADGQ